MRGLGSDQEIVEADTQRSCDSGFLPGCIDSIRGLMTIDGTCQVRILSGLGSPVGGVSWILNIEIRILRARRIRELIIEHATGSVCCAALFP